MKALYKRFALMEFRFKQSVFKCQPFFEIFCKQFSALKNKNAFDILCIDKENAISSRIKDTTLPMNKKIVLPIANE